MACRRGSASASRSPAASRWSLILTHAVKVSNFLLAAVLYMSFTLVTGVKHHGDIERNHLTPCTWRTQEACISLSWKQREQGIPDAHPSMMSSSRGSLTETWFAPQLAYLMRAGIRSAPIRLYRIYRS